MNKFSQPIHRTHIFRPDKKYDEYNIDSLIETVPLCISHKLTNDLIYLYNHDMNLLVSFSRKTACFFKITVQLSEACFANL